MTLPKAVMTLPDLSGVLNEVCGKKKKKSAEGRVSSPHLKFKIKSVDVKNILKVDMF